LPERPSTARPELVAALLEDVAARRHPADGGGRAWLDSDDGQSSAVVGQVGRFAIIFETGPLGVAEGGWVMLQVSPFWGWSTPQVEAPELPGYTEVSTDAAGVELLPATLDQQLLGIQVRGRGLESGETIRIVYGVGPAGAAVDRYAERGSRLWIAVDGDGDGVRALVDESPAVDVHPGEAARLMLMLPATARPGEGVSLTVAVLDRAGNAGLSFAGEVLLEEIPDGIEAPSRVIFSPQHSGSRQVPVGVRSEGVFRLRARGPGALVAESNPMVVRASSARVLWADLHGHSAYSDGTGLPGDYLAYARDVAALDVVALTDHDHWGLPFLDQSPRLWHEISQAVAEIHEPGRFVALLGYEWTSWTWGHRHVLFFSDGGEVYSSLDPRYDEPHELWAVLRGRAAVTIAHHSAGGPIAVDWSVPPDPELEPVTEVASVHGSSEAVDAPDPIYDRVPGNFVRDVLGRGHRLGFVGSGDGHDGHPGLAQLNAASGGLAGIIASERTRGAVLEALRARRVYATNGARVVLEVHLGGLHMGSSVPPGDHIVSVRAAAPGANERVDVVRSPGPVESVPVEDVREISLELEVEGLRSGEFLYVRVVQSDGGAAWSSPFFVD